MVLQSIYSSLKLIEDEIIIIEKKLTELIHEQQPEQLQLLLGIPGMGVKTATMLIVLTEGFKRFQNSSQLCSWVGITPTMRISGSSVRGKSRISKMGNSKLRNLLFLCSFSACKYNKGCREMFERIIAKAKSKKLALIAVSNKLLKQAFAIAKSGLPYNDEYTRHSTLKFQYSAIELA